MDFVAVLAYSGGLLFFFFCRVFPHFQKLLMVIAKGRTGGSRTRYRSGVEVYDTWDRPVRARQEGIGRKL